MQAVAGVVLQVVEVHQRGLAPVVVGQVQVPGLGRDDALHARRQRGVADGQPLVFLADHPTTGGYPVIGVVDSADLPLLAQARPGTTVIFDPWTSTRIWPKASAYGASATMRRCCA